MPGQVHKPGGHCRFRQGSTQAPGLTNSAAGQRHSSLEPERQGLWAASSTPHCPLGLPRHKERAGKRPLHRYHRGAQTRGHTLRARGPCAIGLGPTGLWLYELLAVLQGKQMLAHPASCPSRTSTLGPISSHQDYSDPRAWEARGGGSMGGGGLPRLFKQIGGG